MIFSKKTQQHCRHCLLLVAALVIFSPFLAIPALANKGENETPAKFTPQISIPGSEFTAGQEINAGKIVGATSSSDLLAKYINGFYKYGLSIAGIVAVIALMAAGLIWATSGGDSGKIGQAKKMIAGSLTGIVILACSWIILNTINPQLVSLQTLETKITGGAYEDYITCCDPTIGENRIHVKIVDGKYYGVEGDVKNKPVDCFGPKCSEGQICVLARDNSYACFDNYGCCECAKLNLGIAAFDWVCRNNVPYNSCSCKKYFDLEGETTFFSGSTHACDANNRCVPR